MFRSNCFTFLAVFIALSTTSAQAQQPVGTEGSQFGAGLGLIYSANAIEGASDTVMVVPFFFYEARDWYLRGPFGGYRAYRDPRLSVNLNARVDFNSWKPGDSPALAGMERRKMTVEAGASVAYRLNPVVLNLALWQDVLDRHGGWEGTLSVTYPKRISERLTVIPRVDWTLLSGSKANYLYGVRPGEVAPGRELYRPGRSYTGGLGLSGSYRFNENWMMQADVALTFLSSDLRDSPIVDGRALPRVLFGLLRLF